MIILKKNKSASDHLLEARGVSDHFNKIDSVTNTLC